MNTPIRLMLTGGGTGGHLFPAIAAAEALCRRLPGSKVLFLGTKRKMDGRSLEGSGFATASIHSMGLKGKSIVSLLKGLAVLPLSCIEAMIQILRFKPDLVLGVGGYVTGPVIVIARLMGKPTIIHEQNSIPGLANRKLGLFAEKICISLPGSEKWFPSEKTVLTGNPVRKPLLELAKEDERSEDKNITLLILGGSLGAHRLNELLIDVFALGDPLLAKIKVIHQTGGDDVERVKESYKQNNIDALVEPFFSDMAAVYREADFLVSRAGATTLAELAVLGKPVLLIPYPHAADNHQEKNGQYYVQGGGALQYIEKDLTAETLAKTLRNVLTDRERLTRMGEAMAEKAFPDAAERIVDECLNILSVQKSN